ncbi:MAG TPA: hypothetical protein VKX17_14430 [Planctomycetota bacterium]|nr:hypothetical protein [Planctomycetota bacterium]
MQRFVVKAARLPKFGTVVALCAAALTCRSADSVAVSGGTVVEGQVIRDTPGDPLVVINTGGKLLCLNRSEIVSITLDDENRAEYRKRSMALKDNNAAGHFELYKWAKAQRLYDYADQELSATLKADPRHAEARKIVFAPQTLSRPSAAVAVAAPIDDTPVIGLRAETPTQHAMSEYDEKVMNWCTALLPTFASDESARKAAQAGLTKEGPKAAEVALRYVDAFKSGADEETRLAALAGIEFLKPFNMDVSRRLALTALYDPSAAVRKQDIALIKARDDETAMDSLVKTYISQFEEDNYGKDPITKKAAEAALRGLEDRRVLGSMLYYASLEIRTQNSELKNFVTRQIDAYTVQNGAAFNTALVIPLSFPIQFPELKITSVKTTVKAPCSALSDFTGQNFGDDVEKWAKWLRMQK